MDLSVVFLGTGGSVPTARRATACLLIRARRRPAPDRLRRGLAAPAAALDRAGRSSTTSTSPTSTPTTSSACPGCSRPTTCWGAQAPLRDLGPPGLARAVQRPAPDLRQAQLRGRAGGARAEARRSSTTAIEIRAFAGRAPDDGLGYALVEDERPGPLRPRAARASSASPRTATSGGCSAARRSRWTAARSSPTR